MAADDKNQGAPPSPEENSSGDSSGSEQTPKTDKATEAAPESGDQPDASAGDDGIYDPYDEYGDDPYGYEEQTAAKETAVSVPKTESKPPPPPTPPPAGPEDDEDDDEDGMLRMSFLEHLEELRSRLIRTLMGIGVAFFVSLLFANELWKIVSEPAVEALIKLGYESPKLVQIKPMETFTTVWVKLPILTAIFLASPWVLYQVWAFIAPGLYRRERRWAAPFVICSAGLFILGGLFAYFVAFRFGLSFLLGIGRDINIAPMVSITEYFNLFVNVTLGIGLVFELPVLIFFLTLLRIVTPSFLVRNARYAVLVIVVIAAIITPTPDVVNLMLFSVPMCLLYFVGVFAGYLLNLHRDKRRFPWRILLMVIAVTLSIVAVSVYLAIARHGYQIQPEWPFLIPR